MWKWKLYDDLYVGIPSGIKIDGCEIDAEWTKVRANGNVGLSKTLELPKNPAEFAASFKGMYLRDTACHMKWDSLARSAVGVAAMNAWYNTNERALSLGCGAPAGASGKTAYVGDAGKNKDADVFPLPMSPEFDVKAYERLREYDKVVLASDVLTTRALPKLLEIVGEGGNVIIDGPSLPCSALFFAFGMPVRELCGYYAVNQGDPAKDMKKFCVLSRAL